MTVLSSSYAETASFAINAGDFNTSNFVRTDQTASMTVLSASYAESASYAINAVSAEDYVRNNQTASMTVLSASYAATASFALNAGDFVGENFLPNNGTASFEGRFASTAVQFPKVSKMIGFTSNSTSLSRY